MDQIAALDWVQDEIGGFGGDPANVTVCGQSHGARSAALLTIMPRACGLVHRGIQQSGSFSWGPPAAAGGDSHPAAFGNLDFPLTPEVADGVMGRVLDAAGLSPAEAGRLRDWPAADLLDLQSRVTPRTGGIFYRPVADGDLIRGPFAAVAAGASRGIPLLCGTNLDEMKFFRAMAPGVDTLDGAGLLACCRALRPGVGEAERVIEKYRAARQARGAEPRRQSSGSPSPATSVPSSRHAPGRAARRPYAADLCLPLCLALAGEGGPPWGGPYDGDSVRLRPAG